MIFGFIRTGPKSFQVRKDGWDLGTVYYSPASKGWVWLVEKDIILLKRDLEEVAAFIGNMEG